MNTLAFLGDTLGTVWWSILCFVGGALIGVPVWNWLKTKMPWNN